MIAKWLDSYLKDSDLIKISDAVVKAEKGSDGEIVPIIVHSSGFYGHVPYLLTLIILLTLLLCEMPWLEELALYNWIWVPLIILTYLVSIQLSKLPVVQRALTPYRDRSAQVFLRARLEFLTHRISHTKKRTGILIFVSVTERVAVVLGDEAIDEKISGDEWSRLLNELITSIKKRSMSDGLINAITGAGDIIRKSFPNHDPNNIDELPNSLIIKD